MDFINPFNEKTKDLMGKNLTVHISVFDDKSMDWRVVGVPTDDLIREALKIEKGSGKPNSEKLPEKLTAAQLNSIAEAKAKDMNTEDIEAVKKMVLGTARSMGIEFQN